MTWGAKVCFTSPVTPDQAIDFFGSRSEVAGVCNVTPTAVYHWIRQGRIPYDKQCLIELEARRSRKRGRRVPIARREHAEASAA